MGIKTNGEKKVSLDKSFKFQYVNAVIISNKANWGFGGLPEMARKMSTNIIYNKGTILTSTQQIHGR